MSNKVAEFRILTHSGEQMVSHYYEVYGDASELNKLIQEARQVWDEYYVEVETDMYTQSFSHTYSQEVLMNNK